MAIIEAAGVTKRWGEVTALDDVTVDVPGGVTGLLGANGAGKTTFLGLVLGLHRPDDGRMHVLGADPVAAGPEVRQRLGYSPEHDALPPESRAQDLVRHIAELHGIPSKAAVTRASETLDLVGLGEERLREIQTMSLGQRQRVKLAQAIVHDPTLVLLDEPTNGLDPLQRDNMLATIRRIGHDLGIHVLVCSHLVHEVEQICDHVVVLNAGQLQATGDVSAMVGSGDRMLVEIDGDIGALLADLRAGGLEVDPVDGSRLVVTVTSEEVLDRLRDTVGRLGLGLHRLQRESATLEQRFFGAASSVSLGGPSNATSQPPPPTGLPAEVDR